MKLALTRTTALVTAYAVALQIMLGLAIAASLPFAASAPILCTSDDGAPGHGDRQDSHICISGCVMPGSGFVLADAPPAESWFARPRSSEKSFTTPLPPGPRDRLHALARAPPAV